MSSVRRPALLALLAVSLVLAGCASGGDDDTAGAPPASTTSLVADDPTASPPSTAPAPELEITEMLKNLGTVWAIAFSPSGDLHFTERAGRIGVAPRLPSGGFGEVSYETVQGVRERGEGGLMGLAIDERGRRFVMYTSESDNRVVELLSGGAQRVLVEGIAAGSVHNGGRLILGPDGALYAATGDAGDRSLPRAPGLNGRVLRIDPDGGEVGVLTTGHRNPQGLCFTTAGNLLSTEHGPDRGDEVNHLVAGQDYGWPETTGTGLANWTPTVAPAGCTVYDGELFPALRGSLLFAALKDRSLHRVVPSADLGSAVLRERLLAGRLGRLRDVVTAPDGSIFVATSNTDGRGQPGPADDRILRLTPA